jgi:uncharacterized protein (DUF4415 family)
MKKPKTDLIDDDEIPELDDSWFERAESANVALPKILGPELAAELLGKKPGKRGKQKTPVKESVTVRYSQEVLEYFRATGPGWQARIDSALKEWVRDHRAS